MKILFGIVLIIIGVLLGLYVGMWWAFIGGIVQLIEQTQADTIDALVVAWGITKILCASLFGILSGVVPVLAGLFLIHID